MTTTTRSFLSSAASAAITAALLSGCVAGHRSPVDPVSNADKLDYTVVTAARPDFKEPFLRDGVVTQPARFPSIQAGVPEPRVKELLGEPLQAQAGPRGTEWDYNFKFRMPQSQNYLVCQYKVVFDDSHAVREGVWRRRQCLDLAQGR